MAFVFGGVVEATDYNTLTAQGTPNIGDIFGTGNGDTGYGGNSANVALTDLVTKSPGELIINEDWVNFINAWNDIALHQGNFPLPSGLPGLTLLEDGDFISFFSQLQDASNVSAVDGTNRFSTAGESFTVTPKLTSVRNTSWASNIIHEFTVDFGSFDNARHFFNTGGTIQLSASRTGGSATAQNTNWTNLLNTAGTVSFGGTSTTQSGSGGSFPLSPNDGYYNLTAVFQTFFTQSGSGAYSTNRWDVLVRRDNGPGTNGANGSIIRFRSSFLDAHMGMGGGPDTVDGTFTSQTSERRSTGIFVRPTSTFTNITNLTSGS